MADQDDIDALLNDDVPSGARGNTGTKAAGGTEVPLDADSVDDKFNLNSLIEEGDPGQNLLSIEEAAEPMRNAKDLSAKGEIIIADAKGDDELIY